MNTRLAAAAIGITTALTLTACGSDGGGTAERADTKPANAKKTDGDKGCGKDSDLSQADWMELCGPDAVGNGDGTGGDGTDTPDTELKVGDTYRYPDGLKVTVTRIEPVTKFTEIDSPPTATQTAFRARVKFNNTSKKPVDLDDFSVNGQGATKGGEAEFTSWEIGAKEITGRLAPGQSDTKTEDGVLDKKYGTQLLVTVTRMSDDTDVLEEDPNWTGPIR